MATSGATPLRYGSPSTEAGDGLATLRERLSARVPKRLDDPGARRAAVLVPIYPASDGPHILCFERTHEVLEHKGEICLPGGSIETSDADATAAALREAHEELGILPASVEVLGMLDEVHTTVSNYVISPVVGFVASPPTVVADVLEVARPISIAVETLRMNGAGRYELIAPDGTSRRIYAFMVGADRVWGATARILHGLLTIWFGDGGME